MCGIAGFIGTGDARDLARMADALRHRGPDAGGEWSDPDHAVALAVRRLAILDPTAAVQPMCSSDGALVVVYNGEIYNHRELRRHLERLGAVFRTDHSDTEVLLHAYAIWGAGMVARLNGMWAFAIYDTRRLELFLSRDRFGQKPLYYSQRAGLFAFASEVSSLLQHSAVDRSWSSLSVQKYLAYGFIPAPQSLHQHIAKLPAGCNLTVDVRTLDHEVKRYWDFSLEPRSDVSSGAEAERTLAEELRVLVRDAVTRQLAADVPIGVFLSGGIDSSAISYFAAQETSGPLATFSIGFDHPAFDESSQARTVATLLGTRHTEQRLSGTIARDILPRIASCLDEPIGDSSIICTYLLCEVARKHITVALGGEGADELFGGYDPFRALKAADWYSTLVPKPVHRAIRLVAARLPNRTSYMPFDYRLTRALRGLSYPRALWNPIWIGPLDPADFDACFDEPPNLEQVYSEAIELWDGSRQDGLVEQTMRFYVKLYLQDDILPKVDRAGMMHSLEVRSPFLDLDLVEFARRLPSSLNVRRGRTKSLFKAAMRSVLPAAIVDQPKHGFAVPMADWLRQDWIESDASDGVPGLSREFVRRKWEAHRRGTENNAVLLWSVWLLGQVVDAQRRC